MADASKLSAATLSVLRFVVYGIEREQPLASVVCEGAHEHSNVFVAVVQ
jgi:hypothetical protein